MIVRNFYNLDALDFQPDVATRGIGGDGFLVRLEYQAVRMVEVAGPLTFPVGFQFMEITRFIPDILKCPGICQSA